MSGSCFGSNEAEQALEEASTSTLINCATGSCPRKFLLTYGDPGLNHHNLGRLPELSAKTHEKEIKNNTFPGCPTFDSSKDTVEIIHTTDATAFVKAVNGTTETLGYLAYFGHSWADDGENNRPDGATEEEIGRYYRWPGDGGGLLLIGEEDAASTNLGFRGRNYDNDVPVGYIKRSSFYDGAQIRLFGCRGAWGENPVAKQLADHLGISVFGFESQGGSIFTNDESFGHGERRTRQSDIDNRPNESEDIWMVAAGGAPTMKEF